MVTLDHITSLTSRRNFYLQSKTPCYSLAYCLLPRQIPLGMPLNRLRLVQLLEVLFLFRGQNLASHPNRLLHPLHAAKADNRTGDTLVDPRERNVGDLVKVSLSVPLSLFHTQR